MKPIERRRGAVPLARLVKGAIDPVLARRGFAAADLVGAWDEIAGPRYAAFTRPERIKWPRDREAGGVLTVDVDGGQAIYLDHERDQFIERVNTFLGFAAIAAVQIRQRPVRRPAPVQPPAALPDQEATVLDAAVGGVEDEGLRAALRRLGEGVVRSRLTRP